MTFWLLRVCDFHVLYLLKSRMFDFEYFITNYLLGQNLLKLPRAIDRCFKDIVEIITQQNQEPHKTQPAPLTKF